jgi:hypothetical protein
MLMNSLLSDVQIGADFLVPHSPGDELHNLQLTRREHRIGAA